MAKNKIFLSNAETIISTEKIKLPSGQCPPNNHVADNRSDLHEVYFERNKNKKQNNHIIVISV